MADLLVRLYDLPPLQPLLDKQRTEGVEIRTALPPEKKQVTAWVSQYFPGPWSAECEMAFSHLPVSCLIAVQNEKMLGFVCYEATAKGFFGPLGVKEDCRGRDIGRALTLACLHAMRSAGYTYGIIAWANAPFYEKFLSVMEIPNSAPGIFAGMLK